jgi:hypothetical protein
LNSGKRPPDAAHNTSASEQKIKATLDTKVDLAFGDAPTPLNQVLDFIRDKYRLPIIFDREALQAGKIDVSTMTVQISLKDISLRSALAIILKPLHLTYIVKDEELQIASTATLTTRIYDVRDLVSNERNSPNQKRLDQLVDIIFNTIEPDSWKTGENPGSGRIQSYKGQGTCVIVVFQTYWVHDQIAALLDELRTHKSPKTAKE